MSHYSKKTPTWDSEAGYDDNNNNDNGYRHSKLFEYLEQREIVRNHNRLLVKNTKLSSYTLEIPHLI